MLTHIYIHIYTHFIYVQTHIYIYIYTHFYIYASTHFYISIYMYTIYIHFYTHTHTFCFNALKPLESLESHSLESLDFP